MLKNKLEKTVIYTYLAILIVISVMIVVLYQYVRKSTRENAIDNQKEVTRQITDQVDTFKFPLAQMTNIDFEFMLSNAESYENLYLEITEMLRTSLTLPDVTQTVHPLALKIKSYLEENFEKSVTNEILSREFGFVSSYLSKIFKNQFRMTPGNYLIKLRINKAKSLIRENPDRLIKDIADAVGYNDPYYFSKVFYKEENMWPSDYK